MLDPAVGVERWPNVSPEAFLALRLSARFRGSDLHAESARIASYSIHRQSLQVQLLTHCNMAVVL